MNGEKKWVHLVTTREVINKPAGEQESSGQVPILRQGHFCNKVMPGMWRAENLDLRTNWGLQKFLVERDEISLVTFHRSQSQVVANL